jgi:Mor family transcriptional regulator
MQSELAPIAEDNRWPVQFSMLTDYTIDEIGRLFPDIGKRKSRLLSVHIVRRLAREFGGTAFYIPKADSINRALRDLAIWAEHDGTVDGPNGINELARRHKMTAQSVWAILRRQRDLARTGPPPSPRPRRDLPAE